MQENGHTLESKNFFYKHAISENMPPNTYSMHTHNMYELLYFLEGDATHIIEGRKYKLKQGDLLLIRPLHYHFIQIDSPANYERYDILFDIEKHAVESARLIPDEIEVINLAGNAIADDIFRKTDYYHQNCDTETFEKILSHLLTELFYNLSIAPVQTHEAFDTLSPLLSKALAYINENLCTLKCVEEIAKNLFVSESYLFRLFKNELHQTPKKYISDKRLLLAQRMIAEGQKPVHVYESCGFHDYTAFYRGYTAFFGHSPSQEKRKLP